MTENKMRLGQLSPKFATTDDKGNLISSSILEGSNYVLYFYPKNDTPGCTMEAMEFNKLYTEFESLNCKIFGVSYDNLSSHLSFKEKYCLQIPLLIDTDKKICQAFCVLKEKVNFGKKYIGISRTTFLIDKQGQIAAFWENVDPFNHVAAVLEKLKSLKI